MFNILKILKYPFQLYWEVNIKFSFTYTYIYMRVCVCQQFAFLRINISF